MVAKRWKGGRSAHNDLRFQCCESLNNALFNFNFVFLMCNIHRATNRTGDTGRLMLFILMSFSLQWISPSTKTFPVIIISLHMRWSGWHLQYYYHAHFYNCASMVIRVCSPSTHECFVIAIAYMGILKYNILATLREFHIVSHWSTVTWQNQECIYTLQGWMKNWWTIRLWYTICCQVLWSACWDV